jgi:hypothetical protein
MQNIEEFMKSFFLERNAVEKNELQNFTRLRQKFYTNDCELGRRRSSKLQELLNTTEIIIGVEKLGTRAEVVTTYSDKDGTTVHLRYKLQKQEETWLIQCIELQCPLCKGAKNDRNCQLCNGNGWFPMLGSKERVQS